MPVRVFVIAFLCSFLAPSAQATESPNIIFILADDQAWWDYSFMYRPDVEGPAFDPAISNNHPIYQVAQTPAIDQLADEGITFTHGYTVPLCRPSLQAMITGMFPHQNRVSGNDFVGKVDDEAADQQIMFNQSIARTLVKRLGYRAYQTGKWWGGPYHFAGFTEGDTQDSIDPGTNPSQYTGSRPGYVNKGRHGDWGLMIGRVDYVQDIPSPNPIVYSNTIVPLTDFIDDCVTNNDPFFVWYAPFLPHNPFDPPQYLTDKYDPLIDESPYEHLDWTAKYYANIERLDGGVGAILDHLDSAGIADNTMIIFICDNGWITRPDTGTRDPRAKRNPADAGTRTPIIVHWPSQIKPGGALEPQLITQPVSVIDMVPTALAAVSLEPIPEQRGVNLMDLNAVNARNAIYCDVYEHDMASLENPVETLVANFVVKDGWKLLEFPDNSKELYHLYDTSTSDPVDPFETDDRSSVETAKVTELSQLIDGWYNEPKDMVWSTQASQMQATTAIAIPDALGQSFTITNDSHLVGINLPFQQTNAGQTLTVELRDLDGSGAPLGALLASSTIDPDPIYQGGFHWSLFLFEDPVPVTLGQQLGFLVKSSSQPNTGFNVGYNSPGGYADGTMYYSGTIESNTWDLANLNLPFQALTANYDDGSQSGIFIAEDIVYVSGEMGVRGQPVEMQTSTNLAAGSWITLPVEDNLDGLVATSEVLQPGRKFYRFRLSTIGAPFPISPPSVVTLYEELFDGTGANLNGETPNTTTASETWTTTTTATLLDDGVVSGTTAASAYLPFTPQHGFTYTLEATIEQSAIDEDRWITFGFAGPNPPVTSSQSSSGILWALTRNYSSNDNQVIHENVSGGTGSQVRGNYVTGAATVTMRIVLDTTQGTGNWTYDWRVDGVSRITDRALGSAFESAIGSIGISNRGLGTTNHTYSSFKLTRE